MYVLSFNYTIILYHMWVQSFDHIMLIRIVLYYVIVFRIWWRHCDQFLHYYYLFLLRMITLLTVLFISYVNICATNIFLSLSFWVTVFLFLYWFLNFHISYYLPSYLFMTVILFLIVELNFLFPSSLFESIFLLSRTFLVFVILSLSVSVNYNLFVLLCLR